MPKAEISWKRQDDEGTVLQVYARRFGREWKFYTRHKRYDEWEEATEPPLDDWLELLDAVRRRINRRLLRPEEERKVIEAIKEQYPDYEA